MSLANKKFFDMIRKDPLFFLKVFWGSKESIYFAPFAKFHYKIIKEYLRGLVPVKPGMEKDYKQTTLVMIPRGYSKSKTTAGFCVWSIIVGGREYVQLLSSTASNKSVQNLKDIRRMLETKEFVEIFGDVRGKTWSDKKLQIRFQIGDKVRECIVEARSIGSQTVGSSEWRARPDLVWIDDIEDSESVRTKLQIDKRVTWLNDEIIPGVSFDDPYGRRGQIIITGTPYSPHDNVLFRLERNTGAVKTLKFPVWDWPKGKNVLWPERIPFERVMSQYNSYVLRGALDSWYSNMEMNPRKLKALRFEKEAAVYIASGALWKRKQKENYKTYIIADVAYAKSRTACESGVTVADHFENGDIIFTESTGEKWDALELFNALYDMKCTHEENLEGVYMESKHFDIVRRLFQEYSIRYDKPLNVFRIKDGNINKRARIENLIPHYNRGSLMFLKEKNEKMLNQLWTWTGEDRYYDIIDAAAYHMRFVKILQQVKKKEIEGTTPTRLCKVKDEVAHYYSMKKKQRRYASMECFDGY